MDAGKGSGRKHTLQRSVPPRLQIAIDFTCLAPIPCMATADRCFGRSAIFARHNDYTMSET